MLQGCVLLSRCKNSCFNNILSLNKGPITIAIRIRFNYDKSDQNYDSTTDSTASVKVMSSHYVIEGMCNPDDIFSHCIGTLQKINNFWTNQDIAIVIGP